MKCLPTSRRNSTDPERSEPVARCRAAGLATPRGRSRSRGTARAGARMPSRLAASSSGASRVRSSVLPPGSPISRCRRRPGRSGGGRPAGAGGACTAAAGCPTWRLGRRRVEADVGDERRRRRGGRAAPSSVTWWTRPRKLQVVGEVGTGVACHTVSGPRRAAYRRLRRDGAVDRPVPPVGNFAPVAGGAHRRDAAPGGRGASRRPSRGCSCATGPIRRSLPDPDSLPLVQRRRHGARSGAPRRPGRLLPQPLGGDPQARRRGGHPGAPAARRADRRPGQHPRALARRAAPGPRESRPSPPPLRRPGDDSGSRTSTAR